MRILILGANGQLGKACVSKFENNENIIFAPLSKELNICSFEEVDSYIDNNKPEIVINCAAYTNVDECEKKEDKAYLVNAIGAQNVAIATNKIGSKLVHISTDYVFEGNKNIQLKEFDEINPQNIYGKSKFAGEEFVRNFCYKHYILRTSWLYGEGNNFVRTILKLGVSKKELQVVGDQYGCPTYTKDLANNIESLLNTEYYGTYHASAHGYCSWYDFAMKIFELKGIDIAIKKIESLNLDRLAKRPMYSMLDNYMLKLRNLDNFRDWQDSLYEYLQEDKECLNLNL